MAYQLSVQTFGLECGPPGRGGLFDGHAGLKGPACFLKSVRARTIQEVDDSLWDVARLGVTDGLVAQLARACP